MSFSHIIDNIFLGDCNSAYCFISYYVVNVAEDCNSHLISRNKKTLYLPLRDIQSQDILKEIPKVNKFIDRANGQPVLVHCVMGISRSASFVIAYLMWKYRMTFKDAKSLVKSRRPIIYTNRFDKQLMKYEKSLFKENV